MEFTKGMKPLEGFFELFSTSICERYSNTMVHLVSSRASIYIIHVCTSPMKFGI